MNRGASVGSLACQPRRTDQCQGCVTVPTLFGIEFLPVFVQQRADPGPFFSPHFGSRSCISSGKSVSRLPDPRYPVACKSSSLTPNLGSGMLLSFPGTGAVADPWSTGKTRCRAAAWAVCYAGLAVDQEGSLWHVSRAMGSEPRVPGPWKWARVGPTCMGGHMHRSCSTGCTEMLVLYAFPMRSISCVSSSSIWGKGGGE